MKILDGRIKDGQALYVGDIPSGITVDFRSVFPVRDYFVYSFQGICHEEKMNILEKNKRGFLLRNMWEKPSFFALFFVLRKVFLIIWTCFFHAYRVKWG